MNWKVRHVQPCTALLALETGSPSLRSLAVFHAGEVGIPHSLNGPRAVFGQPASAGEHAHGR